jgi:hypothetical protein
LLYFFCQYTYSYYNLEVYTSQGEEGSGAGKEARPSPAATAVVTAILKN